MAPDQCRAEPRNVWSNNIHFGRYDLLENLGLPTPYEQVTDSTMVRWTSNAKVPYQRRQSRGDTISVRDGLMLEHATRLHDLVVRTQAITTKQKQQHPPFLTA